MKYLKEAIEKVFNDDAELSSVIKKIYFVNKPASGTRPFILVLPIDGEYSYSSKNRIEVIPVTFRIEARTLDALQEAIEKLHNAFDKATLIYLNDDIRHISIRRMGFTGPEEESGTWYYEVDYKIQRVKEV